MGKARRALTLLLRPQGILAAGGYVLALLGVAHFIAYTPPPQLPASHTVFPRFLTAATQLPAHPPVDCAATPCVALTFDDGPDPFTTPQVLDILERHKARATFFVLGAHVQGNEGLIRRIYLNGHEIGNHSWDHPYFSMLSPEQITEQIMKTQDAVRATGVPEPIAFRPPYGDLPSATEAHVPYPIALWNVDPEDYRKAPSEITQHNLEHIQPGRVIVMHDTKQQTADSLDALLNGLPKEYELVTFSELFQITPGQRGRFYGR